MAQQVQLGQGVRALHFPELPPARDKYADVAQRALAAYNQHYVEYSQERGTVNFFAKAREIPGVIKEWTERHDLVVRGTAEDKPSMETLRAERDQKLVVYIAFRHIRDETQKILAQFDEAIGYLTLPKALDKYTIEVLRESGIDVSSVEKRIAGIFGSQQRQEQLSIREQLVQKRDELARFHTEIVANAKLLRQAFEPLARHTDSTTGWGLGASYSYLIESAGQTPYVNDLVSKHDITRARVSQPQQQPEQKEQ